jgi:hypothetical protein
MLGVGEVELDTFVEQTFLALRGIAGMVWQMEIRADRIAHSMKPGSLTEFLAVRLILERLAIEHVIGETESMVDYPSHPSSLSSTSGQRIPELQEVHEFCNRQPTHETMKQKVRCEAFTVFQLAQALGWLPESLLRLNTANWHRLLEEIRNFDVIERQKILHLAYELRYRQQALDAITTNLKRYNRQTQALTPTRRIESDRSSPLKHPKSCLMSWFASTNGKSLFVATWKRSNPAAARGGLPVSLRWRCTIVLRIRSSTFPSAP